MHFSASLLLALPGLVYSAPANDNYGPHGGSSYNLMTNYVNWAIYGRSHFVTDLPADKLTKVNYAFANINNSTGEVFLSDEWADLQYNYPTDVASNETTLFGNLNQLYLLKQKHRNLKTVLSVGGWSYRENFSPAFSTAAGRAKFVNSSVALISDLGLDGLDIDWEYPATEADTTNFVSVVKALREGLDAYAAQYANNYHFLITISSPAGPTNYEKIDVASMDPYVDFWNLMAFDYAGSFSNLTGHQSNVYPSKKNPDATPFNTVQAVEYYTKSISDPSKLILGMPIYGRAFANTKGLGKPYNGTGAGTWEAGVYDYKVLPLNGSKEYFDKETISSYSYDKKTGFLVTYDTPKAARAKTQWLKKNGLGGAFWWESSADKTGEESLVGTVYKTLDGEETLSKDENCLTYPLSKYVNVRGASNSTSSYRRKWQY